MGGMDLEMNRVELVAAVVRDWDETAPPELGRLAMDGTSMSPQTLTCLRIQVGIAVDDGDTRDLLLQMLDTCPPQVWKE